MWLELRQLGADDMAPMNQLLAVFGEAFGDPDTYGAKPPSAAYMRQLLGGDRFIALAALQSGDVVGGLAAYQLHKFEQQAGVLHFDIPVGSGNGGD